MTSKPHSCPGCGLVLEGKRESGRSTPQLRRQFALFRAAYFHWSDTHPFRPRSESHLRRWLVTEAGHFSVVKTIRVESVEADKLAALLTAVLRTSEDDRLFIEADASLIVVKRAKSIAYDELTHAEACKLFDEVAAVLAANDMDAEQLLRETEKAA